MEYYIKNYFSLKIVGIDIKTSYENSIQDIPKLWEKFNQEEIGNLISNKQSDEIYAVYYNYKNDFKGSYNFFIGYSTTGKNEDKSPFKILEIPEQKYAVFSVQGEFPRSLVNTWEAIWESDIKRKYSFDFEKYQSDSSEDSPNLEVYIAIK